MQNSDTKLLSSTAKPTTAETKFRLLQCNNSWNIFSMIFISLDCICVLIFLQVSILCYIGNELSVFHSRYTIPRDEQTIETFKSRRNFLKIYYLSQPYLIFICCFHHFLISQKTSLTLCQRMVKGMFGVMFFFY